MSEVRLIDANALLAKAQELPWGDCGQLCDLIRNATPITPVAPAEGEGESK